MMYSIKHFYEDFTGNSDVKKAQSKVGDLQHKIDIVMEKRSISECELIEVKKQLADLNSSQQDVTREDVDYLDLLKKEFKIHSQKQRLEGLIEVQNYEHQLLLMQLTHALNEVHAKERHEANTLRLIKLCLTTLVAVMGFVGNAGYNHYKDAKVQNHMKLQSTILQTLLEHAEEEKSRKANVSTESWGSYLYRQPGRFYGYMFPKQSSESWGSTVYRQSGRLYRYFFPKDSVLSVSHFHAFATKTMLTSRAMVFCIVQGMKPSTCPLNYIISYRCFADRAKTIDSEKESSYQYYTIGPEQVTKAGPSFKGHGTDVALRRISLVDLAKSKLYEAQSFYDEFSGMNEVKVAQNKVIEIQDQLQLVQERRRHILLELTLVRKQLQDIHIELQKATRGEHRYVELIKQEFDVLAREKEKNQIFQIIDQEERELFSHLTAAVKTSHEKERTQANNVKYWSIIASGVGALLGIVATSINYYFRNTQFETIRKAAEESNRKLAVMEQQLVSLETSLGRMNVEWNRYLSEKRMAEQRRLVRSVPESWGGYFRRHLSRFVRVFVPKA
uniref:Coiled-coil domain-containing protein 51 n=1 Tax=Anopheles epiroticus TaxID=199890 RepID=A0A182PBA7_9DIPT